MKDKEYRGAAKVQRNAPPCRKVCVSPYTALLAGCAEEQQIMVARPATQPASWIGFRKISRASYVTDDSL